MLTVKALNGSTVAIVELCLKPKDVKMKILSDPHYKESTTRP